ncbi:MAG: hypothetical protein WD030_07790 [Pirellulales bacterium]
MTLFLKQPRGIIASGSLMALVVVGAVVGYQVLNQRLPDPATADREGLLKWMVLRDLSEQPDVIQQRLVDRLENELRVGVDLKRVDTEVNEQRRRLFWRNVDFLLERWFRDHVAAFHQLPKAERGDYIRSTVDDLLTWDFVQNWRAEYEDEGGDAAMLSRCEQNVLRWGQRASPELAEQYQHAVVHVKADLMVRSIRGEL